jgi:site-specific DNA recombinase
MKAALYVRVSTEEQAEEGFSIAAQVRQLSEYCKKNNLEVYGEPYVDDGVSAKFSDESKRPAFEHMIKDAEKKLFQLIIVHKYDRFARNVELSQKVKRKLKDAGVNVVSISEPIEDSPIGFVMEGILEIFAEYYIRNLAQESKKGHVERASQGLHNGSVPYGYRIDHNVPAKMSVNEEQAEIVRLIFDLYINKGYGSTKIARILNELGVPSAVGRQWAYFTVNRILNNPKYAGYIKYDGEIHEGLHEAIISKDTFDLVKKYQQDRTWKREYRGINYERYAMLGLLKCGYCGKVMRIHKYTRLHDSYVCNNSTHTDRPDRCTHRKEYITGLLENKIEAEIQGLIEKGFTKPPVQDNTHNFMAARKAKLETKLLRLKEGYLNGAFELEEFLQTEKQIRQELSEIILLPQKTIDLTNCWERYKSASSPTEKRNILKEFISSIDITKEKIAINMQPF